jgi:uncharacterized protein YkwD
VFAYTRTQTILTLSILYALLTLLLPSPATAGAATSERFVADTNRARANYDRHAYRVRDHLTKVAQSWAVWMARHREVRHNPNLESQVDNWCALGENVGSGGTENGIQRAFMNSYYHRENILSTTFRQVGIGTRRGSDGQLYVTEVFRRPC